MIQLREYQHRARDFFLAQNGILGDEPGLGKTFPAIAAAQAVAPNKRKLVVAPAYLLLQWADAIHLYLGSLEPVLMLYSSDDPVPASFTGWVVTSYHTLESACIHPPKTKLKEGQVRRERVAKHPELLSLTWGAVVCDEAHRFRGRKSNWTANAYKLSYDHLWMLTGTPMVNNPGDLWPLLKMLDPKNHRSYWRFVQDWCVLDQTPWSTTVGGLKTGLEPAFDAMLKKYMLRRLIKDELSELPDAIPHPVPVKLDGPIQRMHDLAKRNWLIENPDWDESIAATSGGALVHSLRKITAGVLGVPGGKPLPTPKFQALVELVLDHPNEPVVVFAYYRDTAIAYAEALERLSFPVFLSHGGIVAKKRAEEIERFKAHHENGNPAIMVATLSSMQEGVNLQNARYVVFVEHDYLPGTLTQAIARVRRSGQEHVVNVYHIYAKNTIDETVWRVMQKRHKNVQAALLEDLYLEDLREPLDLSLAA